MKTIYRFENFRKLKVKKPVTVAIGTFDGVHKGHAIIIKKAVELAKKNKGCSVIMTFFPHPRQIVEKRKRPGLLTSLEHRIKLIKQFQPDICLVVNFNKQFASLKPRQFLQEIIKEKLQASQVVVGEKFNFGRAQSGNSLLLHRLQEEFNFKATIIKPLKNQNVIISSSLIRNLVEQGKLTAASSMLSRRFSILGTVIHGSKRGHALGVPTANIDPHQEVVPPEGIYAVGVFLKQRWYKGAMYIGRQPTFYKNKTRLVIEVHIINFHKRIYGQDIEVAFIKKIRSDKAFQSPVLLKKQMHMDIKRVKKLRFLR